jgi:dihydropteroate synthase
MYSINCRGRLLSFEQARIMGILNVTPDSFFTGSRVQQKDEVLSKASDMFKQGADILDIGGFSTRPGAENVGIQEEIDRVAQPIHWIKTEFPESFVSIDTFRSQIVREAYVQGADLVNDISGGSFDEHMMPTVAELQMPYVLSHIQGNLESMHKAYSYNDIPGDIVEYFAFKLDTFHKAGIKDIIIDPGFGFAKSIEQNQALLKGLSAFNFLKHPVMVGLSRKSMLYKPLNLTAPEVLPASLSVAFFALQQGAKLLRVHDVAETRQMMNIFYTFQLHSV